MGCVLVITVLLTMHIMSMEGHGRALKTLKSPDGDVYDCVDIYKQPAFRHPKLKDHKIQMKPSDKFYESMGVEPASPLGSESGFDVQHGRPRLQCPKGTVPIQRTKGKLGKNLKHFLMHNFTGTSSLWQHGPEFAGIKTLPGIGIYHGAEANMDVYNPKVFTHGESSASMISIACEESSGNDMMAAGWMVNPDLYGDAQTRTFISHGTVDSSGLRGCYNLLCPGFVLTARQNIIGSVISPVSTYYTRSQYVAKISIKQDPTTQVWWFSYGSTPIGYWPNTLFRRMEERRGATSIFWGGAVNTPPDQDASPQMGSGRFKYGNYFRTCFMENVGLWNQAFQYQPPQNPSLQIIQSRCYFAGDNSYKSDRRQYSFLFGGKGRLDGQKCVY